MLASILGAYPLRRNHPEDFSIFGIRNGGRFVMDKEIDEDEYLS